MKKNIFKILSIIQVLLITLIACNDEFLDKKPIDTLVTGNFYKTSEGIQMAANAMYSPMGEEGFNGKTIWMIGDGAADDAQPNGVDPDYIPIDEFSLSSDNPRNADLWQIIYRMITLTNTVLENIEGNSAGQDILDQAQGEALALRAYGYFTLVRLYSDVPLILDGMTPEELLAPSRTPANEIFEKIIEDLELASELLSTKSENKARGDDGRLNKNAARGLLAKVYMTIAGDLTMYTTEEYPDNSTQIRAIADQTTCYTEALNLCNEIISSGEDSLLTDFGKLWTREGDNCAESIWQLQFIGCGQRHGSGNMMNAFWAPWESGITAAGDGWGTHSPTKELAACFYPDPDDLLSAITGNSVDTSIVDPPNDLRFYHTLLFPGVEHNELPVPDPNNTEVEIPYALSMGYGKSGFACKKYVIGKGDDVCSMKAPNNVYILRYADILLLKAEILNEQGNPAEAAPVIDKIRLRAGLPVISPSLSQDQMRDAIRLERRRELALEQKRWFDILRWGIAEEVLADQGITLPTERRLFPIPNTEISVNKNLTQNVSY
ncbi:RagB/SusD family nutrient uptake outer membrane protein [Bacteroidota bacterium]